MKKLKRSEKPIANKSLILATINRTYRELLEADLPRLKQVMIDARMDLSKDGNTWPSIVALREIQSHVDACLCETSAILLNHPKFAGMSRAQLDFDIYRTACSVEMREGVSEGMTKLLMNF